MVTDSIHIPAFTIAIDGRENSPYHFRGLRTDAKDGRRPLAVRTEYAHLKTGDYSIKGCESLVTVERKSLADLYSTLGQGRDRFQREHERMTEMQFACVVVESDWQTVINNPPTHSKLNPKTIWRTAISWQLRYDVPWYMLGTRRLAEIWTYRTLERWLSTHVDGPSHDGKQKDLAELHTADTRRP